MTFTGDDTGLGQDPSTGTADSDPGSGQQQVTQEPVFSPFAQQYLQNVPDEEKELVKRHLGQWDGNFTRYAQGVQARLKQYADLGDPDELRSAYKLMQTMREDPGSVAKYLIENGHYDISQHVQGQTPGQAPGQTGQQQTPADDPYAPKFQQYDTQLKQQQQVLTAVANFIKEQKAVREQQEADAQLDQWMGDFRKTYPGVPDKFVYSMINAGVSDAQQIAQEWQSMVQDQVNKRAAPKPPNVMGSGSQPPVAQDVANYTEEQRKQALRTALFGGNNA